MINSPNERPNAYFVRCFLDGVFESMNNLARAIKMGRAVRADPFNPINYRVWALNIEPEFE